MKMNLSAKTMPLKNKKLLLIISGGIAAYKSLDLIRRLKEDGATIRCILTDGGAQFITALSVSALSGEPVFTNLFSPDEEQRLGHIKLSRESDLIIIAPATANIMAKMAHGIADTLASAVLLASNKPILLAPAMNCMMWQHPATQSNLKTLRERGIQTIGPVTGMLACGDVGDGRMSEVQDIQRAIHDFFTCGKPLVGKRILVTSGPTYEPIDPVRFIGNRSSGKQGHAIAQELVHLGAEVTLVTGPCALPDISGGSTRRVETAQEMLEACLSNSPFDVAICAAAVSDWRPQTTADQKIKKAEGSAPPSFTLTENPDILALLSKQGPSRPKLVIGFAAETGDLATLAAAKFERKGCDWLLANDVSHGQVFGQDENEILFFRKDAKGIQSECWPKASKNEIATKLAHAISHLFNT